MPNATAAMPLLRLRDAAFASREGSAGPITLDLSHGERAALHCATPREAKIVALLASGIVKASSGCVFIDDYDPRVQSAACKRIAALVPHEPFALREDEFVRYIAYRAALWNVNVHQAQARALLLRKRLAGMHESFAYPLIAALVGMPKLVILDRPELLYARQILDLLAGCAVFATHTDAAAAVVFARNPLGTAWAAPA